MKSLYFAGKVDSLYIHKWHHGNRMAKISDSVWSKDIVISDWPMAWRYVEVGDSIIKGSDTLILIIKKKDGKKKVFDSKY